MARVLTLAVAVPGLFLCVDRIGDNADGVAQQWRAPTCPVGTSWRTAEDCVAEVTAEVLGLGKSVSCTTDSNGAQSCTTNYSARVRFGERTEKLGVGKAFYDDVERGDRAELRLWRGDVVRMTAGGHIERFFTTTELASAGWLILGWVLLGLAWVAVLGLRLFPLLGGWMVLSVPYVLLAYNVLGLNPMGVLGWSAAGVFTVAGVWAMAATREALL
ncbi:hypothetical protein [Streptomyces sp. NPDC056600]|uniref:hypothetical protein n=1 Tax=Streptomyces sp. NPDC056600 TaxID=3345874 RepID=UPI003691D542